MLFNSIDFALFLPIVFILYWFVLNRNLKAQNGLILVASYFFYGWWDWRFLSLILLSSTVDYIVGIKIDANEKKCKRKRWLWVSVFFNVGLLGFFKYYNFFVESLVAVLSPLGFGMHFGTLKILLPVGISFYTFQTMSYTIYVYRGKIQPEYSFLRFATFGIVSSKKPA